MCRDSSVYEYRILAFVDILGFKDMVYQSACNLQEQKRISDAMEIIHSYKELNDTCFGEEGLRKYGVQVTTFSDSAILSYPIHFDGGLFHVLMDLIHLQIDLSNLGIFIRGGITIGLAHHDEFNAFGPAMNDAYILESKEASSPRIILTRQTLSSGVAASRNHQNPFDLSLLNSIIKQDKDGYYYLDYLRQYQELDYPEYDYYHWLSRIRGYLVSNLNLYYPDAKIYPKYKWMLDYWNGVLNSPNLTVPVEDGSSNDRNMQILDSYRRLAIKPDYPYQ
ncbi:MAG: hypothetical protein NC313_13485 [Butyrivibrio sp.]|nr:hypothetical protein [Butyrivibrio sp.]